MEPMNERFISAEGYIPHGGYHDESGHPAIAFPADKGLNVIWNMVALASTKRMVPAQIKKKEGEEDVTQTRKTGR